MALPDGRGGTWRTLVGAAVLLLLVGATGGAGQELPPRPTQGVGTVPAAAIAGAIASAMGLPPRPTQGWAVATRQAIGQLIASADLLRSGRAADATNLLRGMTADLDRLKGLSRQFREVANREHDRCVPLVTALETKTIEMYQEQQRLEGEIQTLSGEIAAVSAGARVAEAERQRLVMLLSAAADSLRDRGQKLRELTDWWWVPAYGQYLGIRTLAQHDIEGYNNLARALADTSVELQDSQQALQRSNELLSQLQAARWTAAQTAAGLKDMRTRAEAELGELKKTAMALTEAWVLWDKAGKCEASRLNGAKSSGPTTAAGKTRSAMNGVRHGLTGRTFFLLPDEDPAEFQEHEATWLAAWRPRDLAEQDAAEVAIRALWREIRADRLEAQILTDLFGADRIEDEAERRAAKAAAMKSLGTLLRYRAQIARENAAAMRELDALRQRRLAPPQADRRSEPERPTSPPVPATQALAALPVPREPERPLNRHQRRALAAMERKRAA